MKLCFTDILFFKQITNFGKQLLVFGGHRRSCGSGFFFFEHAVHSFYKEENDEGDDDKVNDGTDEQSVFYFSIPYFYHQRIELHSLHQYPDKGHENVVYKRRNYFSESSTDDNTDRKVHHVAAHGE